MKFVVSKPIIFYVKILNFNCLFFLSRCGNFDTVVISKQDLPHLIFPAEFPSAVVTEVPIVFVVHLKILSTKEAKRNGSHFHIHPFLFNDPVHSEIWVVIQTLPHPLVFYLLTVHIDFFWVKFLR